MGHGRAGARGLPGSTGAAREHRGRAHLGAQSVAAAVPEHGQVVEEAQGGAAGAELGRGGQEPPGQPPGAGQRCPRQLAAVGQRPDLRARHGSGTVALEPGLVVFCLFLLSFSPSLLLFSFL